MNTQSRTKHTVKPTAKPTPKPQDTRAAAAQTLAQVLRHGLSLSALLAPAVERVAPRDKGLLQELCYGSMRWFPELNACLQQLLEKPLKPKDSDIQALLLLGLYQLRHTRIPDHAAIDATVNAAKVLKKHWAAKLINGLLRTYQRQREELELELADDAAFVSAHPKWMIKAIEAAWPDAAPQIFAANNGHPPFTLRLNPAFASRTDALAQLAERQLPAQVTAFSPVGITLDKATDVDQLPLFGEGGMSVQDEAAQLAAGLLQLQPGQRVLDACAAPGGKTGHILEAEPGLREVIALDSDPKRLLRVAENLTRLRPASAHKMQCGDATDPSAWWDGELFERILIDAPCSGLGVVRRHPDIKLLRKPADIAKLAQLQQQILTALWPLLAPGGVLVYATCSILPQENTQTVEAFVQAQADAQCDTLDVAWGREQPCGRQLLPQADGHDGFYYARLRKQP